MNITRWSSKQNGMLQPNRSDRCGLTSALIVALQTRAPPICWGADGKA